MNLKSRVNPLRWSGALLLIAATGAIAAEPAQRIDPEGIERLAKATGAQVSVSPATGAARFVRVGADQSLAPRAGAPEAQVDAFLGSYGSIFGLTSPSNELQLKDSRTDALGGRRLAYEQVYHGVPVFAGILLAHFDKAGSLKVVNGVVVPDITVSAIPSRSADDAGRTALAKVAEQLGAKRALEIRASRLVIFREGLAQGIPGPNHLAYEVEVGNGGDVREFVYVDAHSGKSIDQITGTPDALNRRAYDGQFNTNPVPPNYPNTPFWVEGQPFPTGTTEADNMITSSKETYNLFAGAFSRDSFDAAGATMDAIFNRGNACPNASWNGTFISFCNGFTTDDVTGHEWAHAYTQYTHGLIYQWQPGALNESYSDIWGETIDMINARGVDTPNTLRPPTATNCSTFSPPKGELLINSPAGIAGSNPAQSAAFGPALNATGITNAVIVAAPLDGCTAITNGAAIAGKIAFMDRGTCNFTVKVKNAQLVGAVAAVIGNNAPTGLPGMGGSDVTITIPSLGVSQAAGTAIKANATSPGVNATLRAGGGTLDASYRWLMGEEVNPGGALRDMWSPNCYSNPSKVTDLVYYQCGPLSSDNGGVHTNSGVPNKAYALLVDGGTFNGQTVGAIGLVKAAHIYYRAQTTYQNQASDFFDHADALEQSCADLTGVNLPGLSTGAAAGLSGQIITASDCTQVHNAALAVELRTAPTQCNFQPLLAKTPPALCAAGQTPKGFFGDGFDFNAPGWTFSHVGVFSGFTPRDWTAETVDIGHLVTNALVAPDVDGACTGGAGDESGALYADSPEITIPAGGGGLYFDHLVATEGGWDGGNIQISVNGGAYTSIVDANFTYNPYNTTMQTSGAGNTSPLAGQRGFSGTDAGSVSGSWGRSILNLAALAAPGDKVKLRYRFGQDGCGAISGWYLDTIQGYQCATIPTGAAEITAPVSGSVLSIDGPVTFQWTAGAASRYYLEVGSALGGHDLYGADLGGSRSAVVSKLPLDGRALYVRLWSFLPAPTGWVSIDYNYTAGKPVAADFLTPAAGANIAGTTTFTWTKGTLVSSYYLYLGKTQGARDVYDSGPLTGTSKTVTVTTFAGPVWARLWSFLPRTGWTYVDRQYLGSPAQAMITSPVPNSTLVSATQTFNWSPGTNVTQYWLYIGTFEGASDLYDSGPLASSVFSKTVSNLPHSGNIYVRLWSYNGKLGWVYFDARYTMFVP
jgi:Zn-dependent metalloprotease